MGENGNSDRLSSWAPISLQMVTAAMKLKDACSLEKSYDKPRKHIKKQRRYFANKSASSQSYGFSSSQVWMWQLNHKEGWVPKNWCFWTVVLEKTLESPLDCKEIKPVHPKGNKWSTNCLATWCKEPTHWKRPWWWERLKAGGEGGKRGWMVGWHHRLNGHELEQALGDGDGAASMGSQWVRHEWVTEQQADQGLPDVDG